MDTGTIISIVSIAVVIFSVLAITVIIHIARKDFFHKHIEKLKAEGKLETCLEKPENGTITVAEEGMRVSIPRKKEEEVKEIKWDEIDEIIAYKKDLFAVDLICWQFCRLADEYVVEINEEMVGYKVLLKTLENKFGIKEEDWFRKVAIPPFAPNVTSVWKKRCQNEHKCFPM